MFKPGETDFFKNPEYILKNKRPGALPSAPEGSRLAPGMSKGDAETFKNGLLAVGVFFLFFIWDQSTSANRANQLKFWNVYGTSNAYEDCLRDAYSGTERRICWIKDKTGINLFPELDIKD